MGDWPASIEVPDLVGMTGQEARAVCRDLGLFLGYYNMDQQLPRSMVIAHQEPPPGTMAERAAAVRIWTTLDPPPADRQRSDEAG
ncbi:PASTA domain-containing protein [Streptomyces aquilus]|uniref:PASTA domain-containing protein n=1 Tax=Streptomyces aquilus TaxID=2548456 RepID=A0A3S9I6A0_9ACTN|nr:PASTA domain-containing protein [Streptomyces aquilus]AZP19878.1 PASTA domain-containing protein [Streptomyces aquilus]